MPGPIRDKRRKPPRILRGQALLSLTNGPRFQRKKCRRQDRNPRQRKIQTVPIIGVVMAIRIPIATDTVTAHARALLTDRIDTNRTVATAVKIGKRSESGIECAVSDE